MYLLQVKHVLTMCGLWMYSCSLFEQFCPPKFPFLLWLVVSLLHNWTRSPSRSCRLCLRIRVNLGPRISFWSLIFGSNFDPCFGFHFWAPFSALQFSSLAQNGPKNRTQKWYKRLSKWELILNRTVKQSTKRGNLRRFVLAKKNQDFFECSSVNPFRQCSHSCDRQTFFFFIVFISMFSWGHYVSCVCHVKATVRLPGLNNAMSR